MSGSFLSSLTNPQTIVAVLVTLAVFATLYTLIMPVFERKDFAKRMKAVSSERDLIRSRERERLATVTREGKTSLRGNNNKSARRIVEKFNLQEALADKNTMNKLRAAGLRSQNAFNTFLAARFILPFIFLAVAFTWIFVLGNLSDKAFIVRLMAVLLFGYIGFYAPNIYVSNRMNKRQASIKKAWPDALDLMLICIRSGVSMEAAMRRVAEEMGEQSPELAEEMMLTTAELSFLQDRRVALEFRHTNTARSREKRGASAYSGGTLRNAARSGAARSRTGRPRRTHERSGEKAAALPPKLTVPMIVFFLPVLIAVILGPAIIRVLDTF